MHRNIFVFILWPFAVVAAGREKKGKRKSRLALSSRALLRGLQKREREEEDDDSSQTINPRLRSRN